MKNSLIISDEFDKMYDNCLNRMSEKFQRYAKESEKMLTLNEQTLREVVSRGSFLHHSWLSIYHSEKRLLIQMKRKLEQFDSSKLRLDYSKSGTNQLSEEQQQYKLQFDKLRQIINEQEQLIEYLSEIVGIFKNVQFNVKSFLELKKMESSF